VYGLGADATNEKAVSRIYSVKGRPSHHPLIVHISSINKLEDWATDIPDYAIKLAREFWPGPMTLILPRKEIAKDFITGGQNNVGLRVPSQPIALALLKKFEELGGEGVAAPSANKFGAVSTTTAEAVIEELENELDLSDLVLDGGKCSIGIESTIIDCTGDKPKILRPGIITEDILTKVTGETVGIFGNKTIQVPGNLKSHYQPKAEVLINKIPQIGEALIALDLFETPVGVIRLSTPSNLEQFAQELYSSFRLADNLKIKTIHVHLPSGNGIEKALRDRTEKASSRNSG
jgi:L-threonylcarbamoyladenylate synthase